MFKKISLLATVVALLVIILGTYVRLSDAGLGCPDWPGCYGSAIVSDSAQFKSDAASLFPDQELDTTKAWKEMSHRYLAGGLGLLLLVLFGFAWRQTSQRNAAILLSTLLLLLVGLQAALGMWTVNYKVMPIVVTSHLVLGFITFWSLAWTHLRTQAQLKLREQATGPRLIVIVGMLVLLTQIILGAWVSTNYAALACTDFPRCHNAWLPDANYAGAINLLRGLWDDLPTTLSGSEQLAVHVLHRIGALISFIVLSLVMLSATTDHYPKPVRRAGLYLSLLLMIQIALGILNVKLDLPLPIAVAHNALAALLMLPLIALLFFRRYTLGEVAELPEADTVEPLAVLDEVLQTPEIKTEAPVAESLFLRLKTQLNKTRGSLAGVLSSLAFGQKPTNELLDDLEASLLMADLGIETTTKIITELTQNLEKEQLKDANYLSETLKQKLFEILQPCSQPLIIPKQDSPFVILVVGVNGVGKTTSIGKLAHRLQEQGHSVMLAAGDTFRAAAVEQLQTWGERNNIQVVAQHTGADSASVIFDALQSAKAKQVDVLIADTAGRLHTKANLMDELKKIKRIITKLDESAPHEVLLILDAGTGQNALSQARIFNESVTLTGLALTKLDGTAKGGVIFALADQMQIPIRFIGVGEAKEDLQDFDAANFIDALFVKD